MTSRRPIAAFGALATCALALALPQAAGARSAKATVEEFDKVFPLAIKDGKAIVVVAVPNISRKYPSPFDWANAMADDVTDSSAAAAIDDSMVLEWRNTADPAKRLLIGRHQSVREIGGTGYFLEIGGSGKSAYLIYVIDPGTYRLSRVSHLQPRTPPPTKGQFTKNARAAHPVGTIRFDRQNFTETRIEDVWHEAEYWIEPRHQECSAITVHGGCVEYAWVPETRTLTKPAGYYPAPVPVQVPGGKVMIGITSDFASFQAGAGEVLVLDGFWSEPPATTFADADCQYSGNQSVMCDVSEIALVRSQATPSDVQGYNYKLAGYPRLGAILAKAVYRPLDIKARKIGEAKMGPEYLLGQ